MSVLSVALLAPVALAVGAENEGENLGSTTTARLAHSDHKLVAAAHRRIGETLRRAERRRRKRESAGVSPELEAIAQCESGGDPTAIGGGGTYRGKYQFSQATWESVGGTGDPARASEAEQDRRAATLYERSGPGQWPVCSA